MIYLIITLNSGWSEGVLLFYNNSSCCNSNSSFILIHSSIYYYSYNIYKPHHLLLNAFWQKKNLIVQDFYSTFLEGVRDSLQQSTNLWDKMYTLWFLGNMTICIVFMEKEKKWESGNKMPVYIDSCCDVRDNA